MKKPKTIGACVDLAYELRGKRLEKEREYKDEIAALKAEEEEINEYIINTFTKSQIEGAKGSIATASIIRAQFPKVVDWPAVHKWVMKTGSFDIFERRIAKAAFRERLDAGESVPGIEVFNDMSLSLTKVSK